MEAQEELHDIVHQISLSETNCPVEEYISGEVDVPICMLYDDAWEDRFFAELGSSKGDSDFLVQKDPDEEEGQFDLEPCENVWCIYIYCLFGLMLCMTSSCSVAKYLIINFNANTFV